MEHEVIVIHVVIGALETIPKGLVKRLEKLEICKVAETIQPTVLLKNSEKSPGDLQRLDISQTPVRNYQLTLVRKTQKE